MKKHKKNSLEVDANASLLDSVYKKIKWPPGKKFVSFFEGKKFFSSSLEEALEVAEKEFGEDAGFVIRGRDQQPAFFGCLYH